MSENIKNQKLDEIRPHLSIDQYSAIVKFIANNDFSAHSLKSYIVDLEDELKNARSDKMQLELASGISLVYTRYWNKFQRREVKSSGYRSQRTATQNNIVNKYHPDTLYKQEIDFLDSITEYINDTSEELKRLIQILSVYLELFPDAITSPRTKRSELGMSVKSKSSPLLISPRNSPLNSPRNSTDLFSSPRRKSDHRRRSNSKK